MTQPIQEPLTQRQISGLRWGESQLYRRPQPHPMSGNVPVEWITYQSTTNWGTSATVLTFTYLDGNYDTTTPTFDLSSGSPQISRFGIYQYHMTVINVVTTAGVETTVRMDLTNTGGQVPFRINYIPDVHVVGLVGPAGTTTVQSWWQGLLLYSGTGTGSFGTPTSYQVEASKYDDGTIVADTNPYVSLTIIRLGDAYA